MPVMSGPAMFVTAEEPIDEIHWRLEQDMKGRTDPSKDKHLGIISLCDRDAVLGRVVKGEVEPTALFNAIANEAHDRRSKLMVIEAAADVFGGDECDRSQVSGFIRLLRRIPMMIDCAVLLLSHPSVEGMRSGRGVSGSTHWNNAVRSRMYFTAPKAGKNDDEVIDGLRCLSLDKANRGPTGNKIMMQWEDGIYVPTDTKTSNFKQRLAEARAIFIGLMRRYTEQNRKPVGPSPSSTYAPSVFSKEPEAKSTTRTCSRRRWMT